MDGHGRWRRWGAAVVGIALAGTVAACGGRADDDGDTLRFAVTDLQGLEELQREFGAFERTFEERSGLDLEFFAVNDRVAAAAALDSGDVDVVLTGPAEYVVIHERTGAEPVIAIRRDGYRSCLYTSVESGARTLDDLRGQRVAMSDIGSTSGHLGPSQLLLDAGVDPREDVEVLTIGDAVHQALERGDVRAVGIGCHDYEDFVEDGDRAAFPVLREGPPLPPDLLVAGAEVPAPTVETVRTTFRQHFPELLAAMLDGKDNAKYADAELVEVTDADFDVVRSMYQAVGVDDFTDFVGD